MDHSEFDGGGVMPNTVYPMGSDALTPDDKLRLQSITGQEDDPLAPVDPYFWQGNIRPDFAAEKADAAAKKNRQRINARIERRRYKETRQY